MRLIFPRLGSWLLGREWGEAADLVMKLTADGNFFALANGASREDLMR